jgi:ankyrin repeat protein
MRMGINPLGLDTPDTQGRTPLMREVLSEDMERARFIVSAGANPDAEGVLPGGHRRLLMYAAQYRPEWVSFLIESGADIEAVNDMGNTALFIATRFSTTALIHLLDAGARLDHENQAGQTAFGVPPCMPLHGVIWRGEKVTDIIPRVLRRGIHIDAKNPSGQTALMLAAHNETHDAITQLLGFGADPDIKDNRGSTALDYATRASKKTLRVLTTALDHYRLHPEGVTPVCLDKTNPDPHPEERGSPGADALAKIPVMVPVPSPATPAALDLGHPDVVESAIPGWNPAPRAGTPTTRLGR